MFQIPDRVARNIRMHVMDDLSPSMKTVYIKVGVSVIVGGLLSLLVCGQFGIGATSIAVRFNESLHMVHGGILCAIYCGVIFAVVPLILLRVQCRKALFRVIIRKHYHAVLVWLGGFGMMLMYHGDLGAETMAFFVWFCVASAAFRLGAAVLSEGPAYGFLDVPSR